MEFKDVIEKRRSIRAYKDIPVSYELIMEIIDAGLKAPTAGNLNSVRIILIDDKDLITKVAKYAYEQDWIQEAKYIIVVCTINEKLELLYPNEWKKFAIQEASLAAENMLLMCEEQGLASCFVSAFEEEELRRLLNIPKNADPHVILPIGYANEVPLERKKEELVDVVYINSFGSRIRDINKVLKKYPVVAKNSIDRTLEGIGEGAEKIFKNLFKKKSKK